MEPMVSTFSKTIIQMAASYVVSSKTSAFAAITLVLLLLTTCIIGIRSSSTSQNPKDRKRRRIWLPRPLHRLRCWLLSSNSSNAGGGSKAEKERRAKQSFSVRRTDLAKIARGEPTGRQRRRRKDGNKKKMGQNNRRNENQQTVHATYNGIASQKVGACNSWTERISSQIWSAGSGGGGTSIKSNNMTQTQAIRTSQVGEGDNNDGLQNVAIMGLDCEMVGAGRDGSISLLGRCSLVLLVQKAKPADDDDDDTSTKASFEVRTIYDKHIRPSRTVTDYRTPWSGITKNDLKGLGSLPCVPFEVCRSEVSALLASYQGKPVVLVGHALKNDFDVLQLRHPFGLTRDTATYRQFMRPGRANRMLQRKLTHLVEEELGMDIQNGGGGHSSVEDAEAALNLYWKVRCSWEKSLGYPLRCFGSAAATRNDDIPPLVQDKWPPLTLYLDGCNLPLGVRRHKLNDQSCGKENGDVSWQIISKISTQGTTEAYRQVDWIPVFRSALASASTPVFNKIVIMFDGAKYNGSKKEQKVPKLVEIYPNMFLETTEVGVQVDDVLVERCCGSSTNTDHQNATSGPIVQIDDVVDALSNMSDMGYGALDPSENDRLDMYAVVRRKGGGTKTNKKLFDKLNLRRPVEGALCLTGLTARLQKNSLQAAKDLQRARVYDVAEYELRSRANLRNIIVTDDILLADRLVNDCGNDCGGGNPNLVLSWRQLQQMF